MVFTIKINVFICIHGSIPRFCLYRTTSSCNNPVGRWCPDTFSGWRARIKTEYVIGIVGIFIRLLENVADICFGVGRVEVFRVTLDDFMHGRLSLHSLIPYLDFIITS